MPAQSRAACVRRAVSRVVPPRAFSAPSACVQGRRLSGVVAARDLSRSDQVRCVRRPVPLSGELTARCATAESDNERGVVLETAWTCLPLRRMAAAGGQFFGLVVVAMLGAACGAPIARSALDARASEFQACEARPAPDRLACVQRMTLLRDDEPSEGWPCLGFVDGAGWSTNGAPSCLDTMTKGETETCAGGLLTVFREQLRLNLSDLKKGRDDARAHAVDVVRDAKAYLERDGCAGTRKKLEDAASCLQSWQPRPNQFGEVRGLNKVCYIAIERGRINVAEDERRAAPVKEDIRKLVDAIAVVDAEIAEAARAAAVKTVMRTSVEQCRKAWWVERVSACSDARMHDDEKKTCAQTCVESREAGKNDAFKNAEAECERDFARGNDKPSCVLAGTPVAEVDQNVGERVASCTKRCHANGPKARRELRAAEAQRREQAEQAERAERAATRSSSGSKAGSSSGRGPSASPSGAGCCSKCGGNWIADARACPGGDNLCFMCCVGQAPASACGGR